MSDTYDYIIQVIARDATIGGALAVALTGNAADAQTFTDDTAAPLERDGSPAWGVEVIAREPAHLAAASFANGGNPFGLPAETNAAYRATLDIRTGTRAIQGSLRAWAAQLGYTMRGVE